jgi:hypothetical protein
MSLRINHAILHVLDLQGGATQFSQRELDLEERATKSYVQRHVRRAGSSAENRHGAFRPDSSFAGEFEHYLGGGTDFVSFSTMIAQFLYEELRKGEDGDPVDVLVADYDDEPDHAAAAGDEDDADPAAQARAQAAFEGRGERRFAILVLPRKQAFVHDLRREGGLAYNELVRHDATLPNPTQKVDSYAVITAGSLAVDFVDKPRTIAGAETFLIPDGLLQCTSEASTHDVFDAVTRIVEDVAAEYGANTAVKLSKAKAIVAETAAQSEYLAPWEVGSEVFDDEPQMRERFEEAARREELPEQVSVKRGVASRMAKSHRIRTDTGIEIIFPSDYFANSDYIEFVSERDGSTTIEIKNIGAIENR